MLVLLVVATLGLVVYLHRSGPPAAVRLLPQADAIVYVNVGRIRLLAPGHPLGDVVREPGYADFVSQTGFQFERDLEEIALAVHLPQTAASSTPAASSLPEPRYSSVFVAKFNAERLIAYLKKISQGRPAERYRDLDIFHIPVEDRLVRVAILSVDTVAVSNTPAADPIHYMVDRYKEGASPSPKRTMVRDYYQHVPVGSLAWAIGRYVPGQSSLPGEGSALGAPVAATWVASARFTGSLHLRFEAFTSGEPDATKLHDQATAMLGMYRAFQSQAARTTSDPDVKALIDSIEVAQQRDRVVFTATIPVGFIEKALAEPPKPAVTPTPAP